MDAIARDLPRSRAYVLPGWQAMIGRRSLVQRVSSKYFLLICNKWSRCAFYATYRRIPPHEVFL